MTIANDASVVEVFRQIGDQLTRTDGLPLYRQVSDIVRNAIEAGRLQPGDSVPPQRELSVWWGIGEVTTRRALQELAREGHLVARAGGGTVVREAPPSFATLPGATLTVGVAFADLADGYPFTQPLLEGLRDAERPVALRMFDIPDASHGPSLRGLDGLIMMSPVNLRLVAACHELNVPCVLLYSDIADGHSRCVVVDYARGVHQTVEHLHARGARKIALVTAGAQRFSTGQFVDSYRDALEQLELPRRDEWIIHAGYGESDGHRATHRLLAMAARPDAILFASDHPARGGLLAAHELKLRVPEDVRIVGAGNVLGDSGWSVPLTTIDLRVKEAGRMARGAIESMLAGETDVPYRVSIPSQLIVGATS